MKRVVVLFINAEYPFDVDKVFVFYFLLDSYLRYIMHRNIIVDAMKRY